MSIPKQLEVMRSLIGTQWSSGPPSSTILAWEELIATTYPEMASYIRSAERSYIAWCGLTVAYCMTVAGIKPEFGDTDVRRFLWARAWLGFGAAVDTPQPGDVMIFDFGGGDSHVTLYNAAGDASHYECLGGNQSHQVKTSLYAKSQCIGIRRPPQSAQIGTEPDKPATPFVPLDQRTIDAITTAAGASDLVSYSWNGRGRAPIGYLKGMAVTFGMALRKLAARDSAALAMVRVVDGPGDVFDHYEDILKSKDIVTLDAPEADRLRALWVILTGLGMRESSGNYSEGRDMSASNTSADTAEAGLFQQSWGSRKASPEIPKLLTAYQADKYPGFLEVFREGVRDKASDNYGDGDGALFQRIAKIKPAFAVEAAAIGLRTLYTEWGPIIRREAEIIHEADALFRQVQEIVGAAPTIPATPQRPEPMPDPVIDPPAPAPLVPATSPLKQIDPTSIWQRLDNPDIAEMVIGIEVDLVNRRYPSRPRLYLSTIAPGSSSTSSQTTDPVLQKPSVLLGTLGTIVSAVLAHPKVGAINMDTGVLSGILSLGTAALGATGGWGKLATGALTILSKIK